MNGLFAGGLWTRHALLGEIRTPRGRLLNPLALLAAAPIAQATMQQ